MELISIFSFFDDHINNGGFLKMKNSFFPILPVNWYLFYEKELRQTSLKMHAYLKDNGITETDKKIIRNLLNDYQTFIYDDFYKIKIGNEQINLLGRLLPNFIITLFDDIERYERAANNSKLPQEKAIRIDSEDQENVKDIERYQKTAINSEIQQEKAIHIDLEDISEKEINEYSIENTELKTTTETIENKYPYSPPKKTFPDYLNYPQKELFAKLLKTEFGNDKGKKIKILIEILKEQSILTYGDRDFLHFYNSMKEYFENKIGTYQSINDFKYDKVANKKDYESIKLRLQIAIDKYKDKA